MDLEPDAIGALGELDRILIGDSVATVEDWIDVHSTYQLGEPGAVLTGLVILAASRVEARSGPVEIWRPVVDDATTSEALLCARLVSTYLNGDAQTFSALLPAWNAWSKNARAGVLRELIGCIVHYR